MAMLRTCFLTSEMTEWQSFKFIKFKYILAEFRQKIDLLNAQPVQQIGSVGTFNTLCVNSAYSITVITVIG